MVADYQAGRFSVIVCYDLDRLTRQPRQLEDWIDRAETRGLALVTANGDADLSTDGGRLFARIKAAVARGEVERKSARQSRAHVQRASEGRVPKGVRPLGYGADGAVVRKEAKAVRAIYGAFDQGASLRGIARALSGIKEEDDDKAEQVKGVPKLPNHSRTLTIERNKKRAAEDLPAKPVPDDRPWAESTVLGILRNPRYAGYSVYTDVRDRGQRWPTTSPGWPTANDHAASVGTGESSSSRARTACRSRANGRRSSPRTCGSGCSSSSMTTRGLPTASEHTAATWAAASTCVGYAAPSCGAGRAGIAASKPV